MDLTDDEIRTWIERLKSYARGRGYPQLADDFSQEAIAKYLQGRKATFEQLLTDFLRAEYGDTRPHNCNARSRATHGMQSLDTHDFGNLPVAIGSFGRDADGIREYLGGLEPDQRCIIILRYVWSFREAEIADCFGVTESRICQRLKRIQSCISARIAKEKNPGANREGPGEMAGILSEETTGEPQMGFSKDRKMAKRESRGLEEDYETGFDPWLT